MSGCRVFIGRLSPHARERDVEKFFKGYGRIREVNLKNGFGFVEFDDHRDADDAVYELNGKELCSERVTIEHARSRRGRGGGPGMGGGGGGGGGRFSPRFSSYRQGSGDRRGGGGSSRYGPPVRTEHRIIVENLSSRISWQDLKDLMRKVGEVTFVDAHRTNKNEGVVEFASHSDMKNAIDKLDGTDLNGRKLKLSEDRKSRRSRSRSRGSRSYSRSRSRSRSPRSKSPSRSRSRNRSRSPRSASRTPEKKPSSGGGGRAAHRSTSRSPSRSKSRSRTPPARSRSPAPRSRTPPARSRTPPARSRSPAPARKPSRSPSVESQH
ncbi:serine/arginine-rich splicing factor 5 isoform X1 [Coregonus clupeaformis]|uniref:serine/arginine-rich splicing factor 5 isoform X1 n=1 Tax=Coregonus clupeaformis TaxID=59861 RepID=UPI001BDFA7E6|nr:serine/arginine-rich splicing factor 5 isoform X1 [Coregonus clupeaformis]